jgi:hypothetical protein
VDLTDPWSLPMYDLPAADALAAGKNFAEPDLWFVSTLSDSAWLSPRQAARALGVTTDTLARMRANGEGPPYRRLGRLIRYRWGAITGWLDAQRASPTSAAPTHSD